VEERFASLITYIARRSNDNRTYVATIHWTSPLQTNQSIQWEFSALGNSGL